MSDRETVIKELEQFKSDFNPFIGNSSDWNRIDAALAFLKQQEAVEPYVTGNGESFETAKNWWYECGNCNNPIDSTDKFCRHCGRMVKWE